MKAWRIQEVCNALLVVVAFLAVTPSLRAQRELLKSDRPWKGYAILGNGRLCAVYSDDSRVSKEAASRGVQHLYYLDFTTDYVASTSFDLIDAGEVSRPDSIDMEGGVRTVTRSYYANGLVKEVRCCSHLRDAVVLSLGVPGARTPVNHRFRIALRNRIVTDTITVLSSLKTEGDLIVAEWSNGTVLIVAEKVPGGVIEVRDSSVTVLGKTDGNRRVDILVALAKSGKEAMSTVKKLRAEKDPSDVAARHWQQWLGRGKTPRFKTRNGETSRYADFYKRNLYAAKSANLQGQIPADITGQFLTNNMPQLYPRDAMMCARDFLLTGHAEEARQVIRFWGNPNIPKKSTGEFFARYDAHGRAVDAGSGARYDEPEWDANGYFIQLVHQYHSLKHEWLVDRQFLYELADFLVGRIDSLGLLYEGGIVEWTGYLPATNMICAAALETAGQIAENFSDHEKADKYRAASQRISSSLPRMFDRKRETYADIRFHGVKTDNNVSITDRTNDTLYLWDASLYFGIIWGYPDHELFRQSDQFYESHATAMDGGMKYFQATDNAWLSGYGGDVFSFTTAAAAQYHARHGNKVTAKRHVGWLIRNANRYGLMAERIFLNESDCSPASPLSWCCAESAVAILFLSKQ